MPVQSGCNRKGSRQKEVGSFFGRHLSSLGIEDPFRVKNSDGVCMFLPETGPAALNASSLDAKDFFYSLPHERLLECVEECVRDL